MSDLEMIFLRSAYLSMLIGRRADVAQRKVIEQYTGHLGFDPIDDLMISPGAWEHAQEIGVPPEHIFAHPDILQAHPKTSLYYRGMALLSLKQVQQLVKSVKDWESGKRRTRIPRNNAKKVACLYNAVISYIIEGSDDWTLENGYRNILSTMGITLDGMFRNRIGKIAEAFVKSRIVTWLKDSELISGDEPDDKVLHRLPGNTLMEYGSEPDIKFMRGEQMIATIEVKGGTDPAGALERLGAMSKSFAETPPGCSNFLVAGVITPTMEKRLGGIGTVKSYLLNDLKDKDRWDDFMQEVFHHALRVI